MEDLLELKKITNEIIHSFSPNAPENSNNSNKWTLLNVYYNKYLLKKDFDKILTETYRLSILSVLIDSLHSSLFHEKWQETLFDNIFLHGILHESFLTLVKGLDHSEKYKKQKILNLLQKLVQRPFLKNIFKYQCISLKNWNLEYVSKSNTWDHLITALVSMPDRIANETEGKYVKIFCPTYYMPLLISTALKVLHTICDNLRNSQDCSLEFLAKLIGRICILGHADIVAKMYLKEFLNLAESDYIWRRISQNLICKMPSNSLDSFITNILLQTPWYGFVEWILGDEGVKSEKVNYIMSVKLLFFRCLKSDIILQNIIGYFASSPHRESHFIKILDSLLDSWMDERSLRHQNVDQGIYIASALTVCAGWLKQLQLQLNVKDYICKVLQGTQIRLNSTDNSVRSIAMITGNNLLQALDPTSPALEYECPDADLLNHFKDMLRIPSRPSKDTVYFEGLKYLEVAEISKQNEKPDEDIDKEINSDDDLEPYDMSNDIPESKVKRPLYIRDCMMGLIEQKDAEWTEKCLRHAEELIKANPYAAEEVAEEMAKILLHMTDSFSISDFVGLRHHILITLTVQSPLLVSSYLISQFTERDYTIRQRLDILEILAASSASLAKLASNVSETRPVSLNADFTKKEPDCQIIINQRLESKTKRYTKAQKPLFKENKFSAIAGNFFYPLLNSYDKACKILKLHGDDCYVLGRFIYTLGTIMFSASNTLHCSQLGASLLQFLYSVRMHEDVFVRKSIIFAVAATYTAVPSSIMFTDILSDVTNMAEWLQSVAQSDYDHGCVEKALHALIIFHTAEKEGSLLYQMKSLVI